MNVILKTINMVFLGKCFDNWKAFNGRCYIEMQNSFDKPERKSHDTAEKICNDRFGGMLASIPDKKTNMFLARLVTDFGKHL